jgi:hypothetical protein
MSRQAREFAFKFDRNVILQQMAENYKVYYYIFNFIFKIKLLLLLIYIFNNYY